MPLLQTSGNATADAYGGGKAAKVNYIEDCFVSWLSTGNGTSRTVTGPDMTAGGLSITKSRSAATGWHWVDTARGAGLSLSSNTTSAQATESTGVTAFTTTGTSIGSAAQYNTNGATYVDYLLKKQPKFFDVVTWTGNGASSRTFTHNLQAYPNCVIIKRTDSASDWWVWHAYAPNYLQLNSTAAANSTGVYSGGSPTDFTIWDTFGVSANVNGGTYVAYLFAHNAGGFGLTGTDNVISCGSYTGSAGPQNITLGYEPQWILIKRTDTTGDWVLQDSMRGMSLTSDQYFQVNTSNVENSISFGLIYPNATGFTISDTGYNNWNVSGGTYIYIAIRRGPMKVPTDGTKVFNIVTATGGPPVFTPGFVTDMAWTKVKNAAATGFRWVSRLLNGTYTDSSSTSAEAALAQYSFDYQNGWRNATVTDSTLLSWSFQRASGFFDEVCYTGDGIYGTAITHNLGVAPELMIVKSRTASGGTNNWCVYNATLGSSAYLYLNLTDASAAGTYFWGGINPTASNFTVTANANVNQSGITYVAYLFATCPGVSKVFSYTGNGSSQTIGCGFTAGARFVMIKRTDSTGDWYVWDTARGIVSGNDPHLSLNTTAAEVTTDDTIDPDSSGFVVNQLAATNCNVSGATYIGLAIA